MSERKLLTADDVCRIAGKLDARPRVPPTPDEVADLIHTLCDAQSQIKRWVAYELENAETRRVLHGKLSQIEELLK